MDEDISQLIDNINAVIKTNGNEEITGEILNSILNQIVSVFYGITGDKQYLNTETKDNLVDAINELQDLLGQINTIKLLSGTANPNTVPPNGGDYEVRDFYMQTSNLGTIALWIYTGVIGVEWLNLTAKESDIVFVSNLPTNGNSTKLYIRTSDNTIWRWQLGGSVQYPVSTFVQIGGGNVGTLQSVTENGNITDKGIILDGQVDYYSIAFRSTEPSIVKEIISGFRTYDGGESIGLFFIPLNSTLNSNLDVLGLRFNDNNPENPKRLEYTVEGIISGLSGTKIQKFQEEKEGTIALLEDVDANKIKSPFRFTYTGNNATQTLPEPITEVIDLMIEGVGDYDDQIEFTAGETEITITADMLPNMRVKLIYR